MPGKNPTPKALHHAAFIKEQNSLNKETLPCSLDKMAINIKFQNIAKHVSLRPQDVQSNLQLCKQCYCVNN